MKLKSIIIIIIIIMERNPPSGNLITVRSVLRAVRSWLIQKKNGKAQAFPFFLLFFLRFRSLNLNKKKQKMERPGPFRFFFETAIWGLGFQLQKF